MQLQLPASQRLCVTEHPVRRRGAKRQPRESVQGIPDDPGSDRGMVDDVRDGETHQRRDESREIGEDQVEG